MQHDLKTWPEPFEAVWSGTKNFEVRRHDRPFAHGDTLLLREYDPNQESYTGREVTRAITYIVFGGQWGVPEQLCVLGWSSESFKYLLAACQHQILTCPTCHGRGIYSSNDYSIVDAPCPRCDKARAAVAKATKENDNG